MSGSVGLVLERVKIEGFRSLLDVGPVEFGDDLTVLVGPNDAGKTALLDAVAWLLGEYRPDDADISNNLDDDGEAAVTGWFVKRAGETCVLRRRRARDGVVHVEERQMLHVGIGAEPKDLSIGELRRVIREYSIPAPGGTRRQPLEDAVMAWLGLQDPSKFGESWGAPHADIENGLPRAMRFGADGGPDPNREIRTVVLAAITDKLTGEGYRDDIADLRNRLERDAAETHSAIREKLEAHFPELDAVHVDVDFDFTRPSIDVELSFEQRGQRVGFGKIGEGRRRKISIGLYEVELERLARRDNAEDRALIMYDEPDTHLDMAAQRSLFDVLVRQARLPNVSVMVATHSISFLDKVDLESVVRLSHNDMLETQIEALGGVAGIELVTRVAHSLGIRTSTLLDRGCLLVVEGDTEEAAIPDLYRTVMGQSPITHGVTVLNTRGSGSIRGFVEVLVERWGRSVVVLADRDAAELAAEWTEKAGISADRVFLVGTKEFEDAFEPAVWCKALDLVFGTEAGPWSVDQVAEALSGDKPSSGIRNLVAERTRASVAKPELGMALARAATEGDVPDALRQCFERARQVTGGALQ